MKPLTTQAAVIGASLGGCLAAYQLARQGVDTILTSEFPWIGGQLTSQGVPPDEHRYIESFGASASYLAFRNAIRSVYRNDPDFIDNSVMTEGLNPGDGWVSRLCFEPRHAEEYLRTLLAPYIESGRLQLLERAVPVGAHRSGDCIESVTVLHGTAGNTNIEIRADYFLDGTDTGELLALLELPYRLGKESRAEFGELQAPDQANPADQQPITHVVALQKVPAGAERPVATPAAYDFWRAHVLPHYGHPIFSEEIPGGEGFTRVRLPLFGEGETLDLWRYRRVVAGHNWRDACADISLVNWAQNDFALQPLLDGKHKTEAEVLSAARELSLCLVYWLQNHAPRSSVGEPGEGFPELALAPAVLGTEDGFAQQVYVRESRRIIGLETLHQEHIRARYDGDTQPATFENSVGIGLYNMDIHPTCDSYMGSNARVRPFELPLGIFIPRDARNLLPACKNISVTHLVNAATRVHPIEWLVGEVAGLLAAFCLHRGRRPHEVHVRPEFRERLQELLHDSGIPIHWPQHLHRNNEQEATECQD
ncbi:FAD-dependent oxidoreductase [Biformimicrobium ophioploci]|uniref:FAD-dependent oxidoreductase n=1 Tax=Biformimicrobium ophioploci TaxID=3036711 RepID=A0ABQ6LWK2_9GAMM|nr:FAD-dependent oxidoreductase [Microbulbifer sp. NKW57]GMG86470.1 FAD-dependent oxidoreductase [Microbulbifer sp. NKW57]